MWFGNVENVFIGEYHLIDDINIEEAKRKFYFITFT